MLARPRTEVGFVAALTLGGVKGVAAVWEPLLKPLGYSLSLQGVFCHASPVVEFCDRGGKKLGCELADLLIVIDYKGRCGCVTRKASLIQAKMASKAKRVSLAGSSSRKQLYLFQNWPRFKFRETEYGADSYSLTSVKGGAPGSFGVIDRHFKSSVKRPPIWTQHDVKPTPYRVTSEPSFAGFLTRMIGGHGKSYGRLAVPGGADDWSQVVDLLLGVTYSKVFHHAPTLGSSSSPRGVTAVAFWVNSDNDQKSYRRMPGSSWRPPFDGFEVVDDRGPQGISLIRIEVSHSG